MEQTTKHMIKVLQNFFRDAPDYIQVKIVDGNIFNLCVLLRVFEGSLIEQGYYGLIYNVDYPYPLKPPELCFLTPIYHPNILNDGRIRIDVLEDQWSPALTLLPALLTVHTILQNPDFSNPCNSEFAYDWSQNKENCRRKSQEICYLYASSKPAGWD